MNESNFWGIPTGNITLLHVRGCQVPHTCIIGSVRVCDDEADPAYDTVTWKDARGYHRVEAAEIIGAGWIEE